MTDFTLDAGSPLPSGWAVTTAGYFRRKRSVTFDPAVATDEQYELWSIPSHACGAPEVVAACDIGSSKQYVAPGDVLISRINPRLNRTWVVRDKQRFTQIASTEWAVFPRSEGFDSRFLAALLSDNRVRDLLAANASGVGGSLTRARPALFDKIRVPIPPVKEQHRIAEKMELLFAKIDKGVESLKTARAQLKVYRQAVLKHAFEGNLTAQWRDENKNKLETAEKLLARIKRECTARAEHKLQEWETAVNEWNEHGKRGNRPSKPRKAANLQLSPDALEKFPSLPEGQAYTFLANLGELGRGKSKHRPRTAPELFGGPYPFIQTGEVKAASQIIREYSTTYSELGLEQSMLWPKGTLCITIAANIAETAFLGFDGCFPDSVVGFTADTKLVLPEYVELFIKSVRTRIEAYAPATAQKNINLTTLESLVVPLCSLAEQQTLVDRLEAILTAIDDQTSLIDTQLLRADAFRQSILEKAFSGRLVEQNPDDEPAAALLERINAEKASQMPRAKTRQSKVATA